MFRFIIIVIALSACADDSTAPFTGTPAEARHEVADAYCSRMRECSPVSFDESYTGGVAQCDAETESWLMLSPSDPTDCVDSLANRACNTEHSFVAKCGAWYVTP